MGQATWMTLKLWKQFGVDDEDVYCLEKKHNAFLGKKLMKRQQLQAQSLSVTYAIWPPAQSLHVG